MAQEYLLSQSKEGRWIHNSSMVTDQKPQEIAIMAVREKLLEYLPEEIPYNLNLVSELVSC